MTARKDSTKSHVFVTGPFPPPVHGLAVSTESLANKLGDHLRVHRFDVAARIWSGQVHVDSIIRAFRAVYTLGSIVVATARYRPRAILCALSAGRAQAFDIACIAISLITRNRIFVMHHSYAILEEGRSRPGLLRLAQPLFKRCCHVVLCEDMKAVLCKLWRLDPARVIVLSNAAFVVEPGVLAPPKQQSGKLTRERPYRLGFIANLCADKGIWTFLDVVSRLQDEGQSVEAFIAGPIEPTDPVLELELRRRISTMHGVTWSGALHGDARTRFYRHLDLLLFPSVYRHESEPHVILESLAHEVPVITTRRGCIPSAMSDGIAVRTLAGENFVATAVAEITGDIQRVDQAMALQHRCLDYFHTLQQAGTLQFENLIAVLDQGSTVSR